MSELTMTCQPSRSSPEGSEGWLGGRDLNPDNVVQRAVNVFRFALVGSGLFLCGMSHCVSGRGDICHLTHNASWGILGS
jgi:hypothetical protein